MGLIAVPRVLVEEWVRPAPLTTVGDAVVVVDAASGIDVDVVGIAPLVPDAAGAVVVAAVGDAEVEPFGSVLSLPRPVASAEVVFDNTGTSLDVNLTAAIAYADVLSDAVVVIDGVLGVAGVLVVPELPLSVVTVGDAEVSFGYFGDGDDPIFPFNLPLRFTDNPRNIQDAAAYVVVNGVGSLDAVAGVADAGLVFTGDVALTRKGSTPIFPFALPMVFDDPANIQLGSASLAFDMGCECVVDVIGESAVAVTGESVSLGSAVFPWAFPVVLAA